MRRFVLCILLTCCVQFAQAQATLFDAIRKNDLPSVKQELEKGADANSKDADGDYALMLSAVYGSVDMMEVLLDKGANPNLKNTDGETALMWAAHDLDKMKLLLRKGADVNARAATGNTPLLIASVGSQQLTAIRYLVDNGADPLAKNKRGENALMRAALFGDTATISYLLAQGLPIDDMDTTKATALLNAIFNVNRPVTFMLLDRGANPDLKAAFGLTAVTGVVTFNDMPSVKAVLEKAKDINTADDGGYNALMWAVYNEHDNPGIIQALLDKGADINQKAKDGSTALSWAVKKGATKTVELLKKAGAKL